MIISKVGSEPASSPLAIAMKPFGSSSELIVSIFNRVFINCQYPVLLIIR